MLAQPQNQLAYAKNSKPLHYSVIKSTLGRFCSSYTGLHKPAGLGT